MNKYIVVKLEDGSKYAIIDILNYENKIYFLITPTFNNGKFINNEFMICQYDEVKNSFEEVETNYKDIKRIFDERLKDEQTKLNYLDQLEDKMHKFKIISINNYDYTLEDEKGNKIIKNLDFYNYELNINDYLYIPERIVKEINIFQYGDIYNFNKLELDELIKIETKKDICFLQRYYG